MDKKRTKAAMERMHHFWNSKCFISFTVHQIESYLAQCSFSTVDCSRCCIKSETIVFDNTSRENELREKNWDANLQKAYEIGKGLFA